MSILKDRRMCVRPICCVRQKPNFNNGHVSFAPRIPSRERKRNLRWNMKSRGYEVETYSCQSTSTVSVLMSPVTANLLSKKEKDEMGSVHVTEQRER
jgi:hypothetical protein